MDSVACYEIDTRLIQRLIQSHSGPARSVFVCVGGQRSTLQCLSPGRRVGHVCYTVGVVGGQKERLCHIGMGVRRTCSDDEERRKLRFPRSRESDQGQQKR